MRLIKIFIVIFQGVFGLGPAIAQSVVSIEEEIRSCTSFREIVAWSGSYLIGNTVHGPPSQVSPNIISALILAPLSGNERSIAILGFDSEPSLLTLEIFDDTGNSRLLLKKYETVATCRDGVIVVRTQTEGGGESGNNYISQNSELTRYATGFKIGLERTFTPVRNPSKAVVRKTTYFFRRVAKETN